MKAGFYLVCAAFCVATLLWATATNSQYQAGQQAPAFPADGDLQKVALRCTPGGGVAGTVKITNTSTETILDGSTVYLANFGGSTIAQLSEQLSPGASRQVPGPPGAFRTCLAWFYKQPGN